MWLSTDVKDFNLQSITKVQFSCGDVDSAQDEMFFQIPARMWNCAASERRTIKKKNYRFGNSGETSANQP